MKKTVYLSVLLLCLISPIFAADMTKLSSSEIADSVDSMASEEWLLLGVTDTDLANSIDSYVAEHEKTNAGLSFAIFARDGVLYEGYHGYADKENGIAVDQNTVMEWGSVTKLLVWASIMQLAERGDLSLTDDITEYLPEGFLTRLQYDTPVTMYNLMHHNAGWEDALLACYVGSEKNLPDLEMALRRGEPKQVFQPGEITAYSNWGTALAGYIVECITGQPFYAYVHENIFDVLGMEHTALSTDLSDNTWVKEQRNSLKYYSAAGKKLDIPYSYTPLYPAGNAVGTLSDLLRFAMALVPNKTGNSPLFQETQTLQDFSATSLYYADGKTARNSHGFWATSYAVPVIGHSGNTVGCSAHLQINPRSRVGVVVMTNQSQEGIYNYGIMPLIFGEYTANNTPLSDVAEVEGMYLSTRVAFSGMLKWMQLINIMPLVKSADNMLTNSLTSQPVTQIDTDTYSLNMTPDVKMKLKSSVSGAKTMMSLSVMDYVKVSQGSVIFKIVSFALFFVVAIYAFISLICTLVRRIKHKQTQPFGTLRLVNDIAILLCPVNLLLFMLSIAAYIGTEFFMGTYTSAFIQGLLFIIFAIIPVVFTVLWIVGYKKQKIDKKQRIWLIISSVAGLIITFNVIFWNLYMIW